jgi:uroporphyrinogen-III synthase
MDLNPLHVHCVVEGLGHALPHHMGVGEVILPTLQVQPLVANFPNISSNFQLICTSKNAVAVFREQVLFWKIPWDLCQGVGAVGPGTALMLEEVFQDLGLDLPQGVVTTPRAGHGLQALLNTPEFLEPQMQVIVLTTQGGVSEDILKQCDPLFFMCLPLYKLEPLPLNFSTFLENPPTEKQHPVVFHCASGQVLHALVDGLKQFYGVVELWDLPGDIYFHVWGESTEHALKVLGLVGQRWLPSKPPH